MTILESGISVYMSGKVRLKCYGYEVDDANPLMRTHIISLDNSN